MTLDIFKGTLAIIGLPDYTSRQRGDVRSNAQMVTRKSNGPDTVAIALLQTVDFQNAHVFKGNWVTRRTGIKYQISCPATRTIGRASCRERECKYVLILVVGVTLKKKQKTKNTH